jgi:hypothetical protein
MPYFLRAIYSNIKWDITQFPSWLKESDLPSCIIRDLRADDNALSLWEILDDKSNLLDIIAAFASLRKDIKRDFDYALLNANYLDELTFTPSKKPGRTAYHDVNHYHRNIPNLSINSVVRFAHLLSRHGEFDRMGWKDIENRLKEAHKKRQLDLDQMPQELKKQLGIP